MMKPPLSACLAAVVGLALLTLLLLLAPGASLPAAAQPAPPTSSLLDRQPAVPETPLAGQITGTVSTAAGPSRYGVVKAYVSQTAGPYDYVASAYTDYYGKYALTGLSARTYYVKFEPPYGSDYTAQYWNGKSSLAVADPIIVAADATVPNINALLPLGGKITGRVTASQGGAPLFSASVRLYDRNTGSPSALAYASTGATGYYTFTGLLTGAYYVGFEGPYDQDYLPEYYNNKATLAQADPIAATLGNTTPDIDAALDIGAKIAGRVTGSDGNPPLSGVTVRAYTSRSAQTYDYVAYATTQASGYYTITSLATGVYYLMFSPGYGSGYIEEYYDDRPALANADPVNATLGSVTGNINAVLQLSARISGRVTAQDSGGGLKDVYVTAYGLDECNDMTSLGSATTNASGYYTVTGLAGGTYWLEYDPSSSGASARYLGEYYNDKTSLGTADPVSVAVGNLLSGINAALTPGGTITGRVTAADGGAALAGVSVYAQPTGSYGGNSATTDASGYYTVTALATGSYKLRYSPYGSSVNAYLARYYHDKDNSVSADLVSVTAPNTTPGINQALLRGARITGQVTTADTHQPIANAYVEIYSSGGAGSYVGYATTNSTGAYTTTGLVSGGYRVRMSASSYGSFASYAYQYYNDKTTRQAGDLVNATVPAVVPNVNAALHIGGQISGTVRAADTGLPLSGIYVAVYDSTGTNEENSYTDSQGHYLTPSLPPGSYRLYFGDKTIYAGCNIAVQYGSEYYNNKGTLATADPVVVTAGHVTGGADALLEVRTKRLIYLPALRR